MSEFHLRRDGECPCRGCPDRYTACSDHCRKPKFLEWKRGGEIIRRNRQQYNRRKDESFRHSEQRRKWE